MRCGPPVALARSRIVRHDSCVPEQTASTLTELLDGNRRFVSGTPEYPRDIEAAKAVAGGQQPTAAVFTCIDSRVVPEVLFDRDFGQILVARTAGHVIDRAAAGSLEFGAAELGVSVIVVLGHERCGAVKAALDAVEHGETEPGYLVEQLWQPAAQAIEETPEGEDPAPLALRLQVQRTVADLRRSEHLEDVLVVGAVYDLDTGEVTLIEET